MTNKNDKQSLLNEVDETVIGLVNLTDADLGLVGGGRADASSKGENFVLVEVGTNGSSNIYKCVK